MSLSHIGKFPTPKHCATKIPAPLQSPITRDSIKKVRLPVLPTPANACLLGIFPQSLHQLDYTPVGTHHLLLWNGKSWPPKAWAFLLSYFFHCLNVLSVTAWLSFICHLQGMISHINIRYNDNLGKIYPILHYFIFLTLKSCKYRQLYLI